MTRPRMRLPRALAVAAADVCVDGPPETVDYATATSHLVVRGWRLCGREMRDARLADSDVPTCPVCRALADRAAETLRRDAEARP